MTIPLPVRIALLLACMPAFSAPARGIAADPVKPVAGGQKADAASPAEPERLELSTSDGIDLAAWHYAALRDQEADEATKPATVLLVHDLMGSHESVEPLALALQRKGFTVVAPDLRGHGESRPSASEGPARKGSNDASLLRKADLEAIAVAAGGTVRDQITSRGELETLRAWIKARADAGELDMNRLCIVGSGLGATLATLWSANDWMWGDRMLASGPQGRHVQALVLVSPVWASKGVTISPAVNAAGVKDSIPMLVLGGSSDRDAARLFDQLKRSRPTSWFEQRVGGEPKGSPDLEKPADASLFFIQFNSPLSADELLAAPGSGAADRIAGFLTLVLNRKAK